MNKGLIFLLSDSSACLRFRVLTELVGLPRNSAEVKEVRELRKKDPLCSLLAGSLKNLSLRSAIIELRKLALLGFDRRSKAVRERAEFLFSKQRKDGSWPLNYGPGTSSQPSGYP